MPAPGSKSIALHLCEMSNFESFAVPFSFGIPLVFQIFVF